MRVFRHGCGSAEAMFSVVPLYAGQQMTLHASIKAQLTRTVKHKWFMCTSVQVASTETGIIFGYVTFEKKSAATRLM